MNVQRLGGAIALVVFMTACSSGAGTTVPSAEPGGYASGSKLTAKPSGRVHPFYAKLSSRHRRRPNSMQAQGNVYYNGGRLQTNPVVYVDFWGFNGANDTAHDPDGVASRLLSFLGALPGSSWLNATTQYYQLNVFTGNGTPTYVTNPSALAGASNVWYDTTPPPQQNYTEAQFDAEAANAVAHFGYNAQANYVIVTPHGYAGPNFATITTGPNAVCAYHEQLFVGNTGSAFSATDLPYVPDAGSNCGANQVSGPLDGVSIVAGHEIAESITDPFYVGWYDSAGQEIGDKCAWQGIAATAFANGTFPTQPLWSNANGTCMQSYRAVGHPKNPGTLLALDGRSIDWWGYPYSGSPGGAVVTFNILKNAAMLGYNQQAGAVLVRGTQRLTMVRGTAQFFNAYSLSGAYLGGTSASSSDQNPSMVAASDGTAFYAEALLAGTNAGAVYPMAASTYSAGTALPAVTEPFALAADGGDDVLVADYASKQVERYYVPWLTSLPAGDTLPNETLPLTSGPLNIAVNHLNQLFALCDDGYLRFYLVPTLDYPPGYAQPDAQFYDPQTPGVPESPHWMAFDSKDDLFVVGPNDTGVVEYAPISAPAHSPYVLVGNVAGGIVGKPTALAVDAQDWLWVADQSTTIKGYAPPYTTVSATVTTTNVPKDLIVTPPVPKP